MEQAIQQFKTDISNSISMGDKKHAVCFLAAKVGEDVAIKIAQEHGLNSSYYFSKLI
jgi:hypothetical protein